MPTTAELLYDHFDGKGAPIGFPIVITLFGYVNWTEDMQENIDDTLVLFSGIFKGLYLMDVSSNEIHNAFLENKLDDLIHTKYKSYNSKILSYNPKSKRRYASNYYRDFCEKKITIGKTFLEDPDDA